MGMVDYRVTVDLGSFKRFKKYLKSNRGEISKAYLDWAKFYTEFTRKRFLRASKGGAGWRRLKPATIREKRRLGFRQPERILIRSRKMLNSLRARFIGSTSTITKKRVGISVSYGTKRKYRNGPLVASVMKYHQTGAGRLPKRRIFINPDGTIKKKMAKRMEKAIQEILDKES